MKIPHFKYYLILAIIVVLGYWQISLMQNTPVYDILDAYFPWRYFIGESLQNGQLPLWEPYQQLGTPFHANPNSGAWYLIAHLIGYCFGYSMKWMNAEWVFHAVIAAIGFFRLLKNLKTDSALAVFLSVSYAFSGFFISNAQHLTWLISAAWIPLVINSYINLLKKSRFKYSIWLAIFCFLLITGGYPAFAIILFYLLLFHSIYFVCSSDKAMRFRFLMYLLIAGIFLVVLCAPLFVSLIANAEVISRADSVSYLVATSNSFTPQCLISFVYPFATVRNFADFNTDISMSNIYIGLVALLLVLLTLSSKDRRGMILILFSVLFVVLSFGNYTPLYKFVYYFVPGFSHLRAPSLFRLFAIIGFLVFIGMQSEKLIRFNNPKRVYVSIFILISICSLITFWAFVFNASKLWPFILNGEIAQYSASNFQDHILLQTPIQIGTLFFIGFWFLIKKKLNLNMIYIVGILNIMIVVQYEFPYTVISPVKPSQSDEYLQKFPKGFPLISSEKIDFNEASHQKLNFYRNIAIYHKKHAFTGFNSFVTKTFSQRIEFDTNAQFFVARHPLIYSLLDDSLRVESYNPQKIEFVMNNSKLDTVFFQQNNTPLWTATIDNKMVDIQPSSLGLMKISVPAGSHRICFKYSSSIFSWLYIFSTSLFMISLSFLIFIWVIKKK